MFKDNEFLRKDYHWLNPLAIIQLVVGLFPPRSRVHLGEYVMVMGILSILQFTVWVAVPGVIAYRALAKTPLGNYSEGEIKAKTIKLSTKGYVWKTLEGHVLTGALSEGVAEKWSYSVVDSKVAECINSSEEAKLYYTQYLLVPWQVGDSSHIVTKCEKVK